MTTKLMGNPLTQRFWNWVEKLAISLAFLYYGLGLFAPFSSSNWVIVLGWKFGTLLLAIFLWRKRASLWASLVIVALMVPVMYTTVTNAQSIISMVTAVIMVIGATIFVLFVVSRGSRNQQGDPWWEQHLKILRSRDARK